MPLAVATPIEDQSARAHASVVYLQTQAQKTPEQRLADLEAWQLGANEILASIAEMHETTRWVKKTVKRWAPPIAVAAITSGLVGGKGAEFLAAFLKAAGVPLS